MRSSCPISCALDILGDHWSLVVLRDVVLLNRRRFSEIARNESIATNILSERLNRLELAGLIRRVKNEKDRRGRLIEPTEKSLDLIPLLTELLIFGAEHCGGQIDASILDRAKTERAQFIAEKREEAVKGRQPAA